MLVALSWFLFGENYLFRELAFLNSLDNLDDILVIKLMIFSNFLWLMLDGGAPHQRVLHLLDDRTMNLVTKVLNLKLAKRDR